MYLDNNLGSMKGCIMNYIDFFKRQAKNLLKDYQTRKPYSDGNITVYEYEPKYFDIDSIFVDFGNLNSIFYKYRCSEDDFKLGNAQHIIALMVGFKNWNELIKASEDELKLAKMLFDNQEKISIADFILAMEMYKNDYDIDTNLHFKFQWLEEYLKSDTFTTFPVYSLSTLKKRGWSNNAEKFNQSETQTSGSSSPQKQPQSEKTEYINNSFDNILCLHCGNICPADKEFIHAPDCDAMDWDLIPTNEPVNV